MQLTDLCTDDYSKLGLGFLLVVALIIVAFYGLKNFIKFPPVIDFKKELKEAAKVIVVAMLIVLTCFFGYWILYGIGWVINLILCGL